MKEEAFKEDLNDMIEFDKGFDINQVLSSLPDLEEETKPEKVVEEKKDKEPSLQNINDVLERQDKDLKEDTKTVEKVVEDIDDKAPASPKTTETSSDAPFTVIFARDLVAQGLLSSFNEEEFLENSKELGEAEALRALIKGEIDANTNAIKSDLDAGYQEYLSLVGKGVAPETAGNLLELKDRFEKIKPDELDKEDNGDLRKQILVDYFKLTTSMSDAKINKLVQNSVDMGDDVEDSKEYLGIINKLVKDQISEEQQVAERNAALQRDEQKRKTDALRDDINALDEIIPGVGINKQTKVKMFDTLIKPVTDTQGRTTNALWAKRSEDPMTFDMKLSYLLETGFFEKGKTWTKAAQAKVTKEVSNLEKVLKDKSNTASKTGSTILRSPEQDKTSRDNIESMRGILGK
jgi:hypothetical protein